MAYAIKVTLKGKRVYAGNNGIPSKYSTKNEARKDIEKYLKGKGLRPSVTKYPDVANF